jgi:Uri superfamily endonuclease
MSMSKGVYVLIVAMNKHLNVKVGALDELNFEKGLYAYVGSAQKGLEKRIERHLRKAKRKFWHIDYLLGNASVEVLKILCKKAGKAEECVIATKISGRGAAIEGFGSSDCRCPSHLFKICNDQFLREIMPETLSVQ